MDNKGDLLAGVIFGAVIGYGAGMLLAPASGEETRQQIWDTTESIASHAGEKGKEIISQARSSRQELAEKFREGARDVISEIREQVSEGISLEDALRKLEEKLEA